MCAKAFFSVPRGEKNNKKTLKSLMRCFSGTHLCKLTSAYMCFKLYEWMQELQIFSAMNHTEGYEISTPLPPTHTHTLPHM